MKLRKGRRLSFWKWTILRVDLSFFMPKKDQKGRTCILGSIYVDWMVESWFSHWLYGIPLFFHVLESYTKTRAGLGRIATDFRHPELRLIFADEVPCSSAWSSDRNVAGTVWLIRLITEFLGTPNFRQTPAKNPAILRTKPCRYPLHPICFISIASRMPSFRYHGPYRTTWYQHITQYFSPLSHYHPIIIPL